MNTEQEFLEEFKKLEAELISVAKIRDDYVSFSRALNKVYYERLNPVVADVDVYEFLKTASDLRNILVHRLEVCEPTAVFLAKFKKTVKEITNPAKCLDVCTKGADLVSCHPGNLVREVAAIMVEAGLSHIPVLTGEGIVGVFSRTSFFEYYAQRGKLETTEDFTIRDLLDVIRLEQHSNERYLFVSPKTPVYEVYKVISKKEPKARRLSCVFVTQNGRSDGKLVGIITETDLVKMPLDKLLQ